VHWNYSAVKDIFLRLLKPGKNYKQAFQRHCERLWQKKLVDDPWADPQAKRYEKKFLAKVGFISVVTVIALLVLERYGREMEENCVMDKKEMKKFLVSMGIVMQDEQVLSSSNIRFDCQQVINPVPSILLLSL